MTEEEKRPVVTLGSRLAAVDLLRGIACLWVVLYHLRIESFAEAPEFFREELLAPIRSALWTWAGMGFQGVTLFLLISGFCLAYPIARRGPLAEAPAAPFLPFLRRRAERILPPYYVALGAWALLLSLPMLAKVPGAQFTMGNLLGKIGMIHNLNQHWVIGINDSFWSLGLEFQLYLLFPALLATVRQYGLKKTLLMAFFLSLAWQRYSAWAVGVQAPFDEGVPWFFSPPGRLFPFVLGIACAEWVARPRPDQARRCLGMLALLLPLCTILAINQGGRPFSIWVDPLSSLTFAAVLLYLASIPDSLLLNGMVGRFVRPLVAFGTISYSVYLWHQPLLRVAVTLLPDFCHNSALATLLTLGAILAVGIAAYTLVEKPFILGSQARRKAMAAQAMAAPENPLMASSLAS